MKKFLKGLMMAALVLPCMFFSVACSCDKEPTQKELNEMGLTEIKKAGKATETYNGDKTVEQKSKMTTTISYYEGDRKLTEDEISGFLEEGDSIEDLTQQEEQRTITTIDIETGELTERKYETVQDVEELTGYYQIVKEGDVYKLYEHHENDGYPFEDVYFVSPEHGKEVFFDGTIWDSSYLSGIPENSIDEVEKMEDLLIYFELGEMVESIYGTESEVPGVQKTLAFSKEGEKWVFSVNMVFASQGNSTESFMTVSGLEIEAKAYFTEEGFEKITMSSNMTFDTQVLDPSSGKNITAKTNMVIVAEQSMTKVYKEDIKLTAAELALFEDEVASQKYMGYSIHSDILDEEEGRSYGYSYEDSISSLTTNFYNSLGLQTEDVTIKFYYDEEMTKEFVISGETKAPSYDVRLYAKVVPTQGKALVIVEKNTETSGSESIIYSGTTIVDIATSPTYTFETEYQTGTPWTTITVDGVEQGTGVTSIQCEDQRIYKVVYTYVVPETTE